MVNVRLFLIKHAWNHKIRKIMAQLSHSMPSKSFSTARMMLSHEKWCQLVNRFSIRRSLRVTHGLVRGTPFPHKTRMKSQNTQNYGSIVTLNAFQIVLYRRMMLSHEKWCQLVNRFSIRRSLRVPHGMVRVTPFPHKHTKTWLNCHTQCLPNRSLPREWCLVMRNDANLSTESVSDVHLEDDMGW